MPRTHARAKPPRIEKRPSPLKDREVVVLGLGRVGLPLAIFLARSGFHVTGVDISEKVVAAVRDGVLAVPEKSLEALFRERAVRKNLQASMVPKPADVFILCVPTPLAAGQREARLDSVRAALGAVLPYLRKGNLVILESTVPPLTCRKVLAPQIESGTGLKVNVDVGLVHCPERVFPGDTARELVHDDRVIGSESRGAAERARRLYATFVKGRISLTDDVTAEFVKLIENSYRDLNIAFANELAAYSEGIGIDVRRAIDIANQHPRVHIHRPGIGVGGHCIPVVPWFLAQVDPDHTRLIQLARAINDRMPEQTASKIRAAVADVPRPTVVLIGMGYKPETGDMLDSPAMRVASVLQAAGIELKHFDPLVEGAGYASLADAARGADLLVILVPHRAVVEELEREEQAIESAMRTPRILRF